MPVRFQTLQEAQNQNGLSRIYNGVHWLWDDTAGQEMGESIGQHVLVDESAFQPISTGVLFGDCNGDGVVDLLDIQPFVDFIMSGEFKIEADVNQDGVVDLLDIQPLIDILLGDS